MLVVSTELQEALELLPRHEQHNCYHAEIETLETRTQVKPQNKSCRLYPFPHEGIL